MLLFGQFGDRCGNHLLPVARRNPVVSFDFANVEAAVDRARGSGWEVSRGEPLDAGVRESVTACLIHYHFGQLRPCCFARVDEVINPRRCSAIVDQSQDDCRQRVGNVAGARWTAPLIADDTNLVAINRQAEHGLDEIGAKRADHPCGAHDDKPIAGRGRSDFASELARAVNTRRANGIGLATEARARNAKHIIRRDVDHGNVSRARRARQPAGPARIDLVRGIGLVLGAVYRGKSSAVDDRSTLGFRYELLNAFAVGKVEGTAIGKYKLYAMGPRIPSQFLSNLALSASDEDGARHVSQAYQAARCRSDRPKAVPTSHAAPDTSRLSSQSLPQKSL